MGAAFAVARRLLEPEDEEAIRALTREVVRLAAELREAREKPVTAAPQLAPPGPTVRELCEWWMGTKAFRSLSSKDDRAHHLNHYILPALGEYTQETLTSDAVEVMLEDAREEDGLAGSTLNAIRAALSKVINDAKSTVPPRWTAANPVGGVDRYETVEREPPMLTPAQAWGIIEAAPPHWRALFAVAIYLGLRAGELRGLKVEDVDPIHRILHVRHSGRRKGTKAGAEKTRKIPVPDELWPLLARARKEKAGGAWLFGHGGHPLTKNWKSAQLCRSVIKRAGLFSSITWVCNHKKGCDAVFLEEQPNNRCPDCGYGLRKTTKPLEMEFHDLRHLSASLHQKAGCHIWVMAKVLGHAMPKVMTLRYTHFTDEEIRAELNRLKLRPLSPGGPGGTGGRHQEGLDTDTGVSQGDTQLNIGARSSVGQSIGLRIRCPVEPGGHGDVAESPSPEKVARFWSFVARGPANGCWLWTGRSGVTRVLGRQELVRRVAYRLTRGVLGRKQAVLTSCGNPRCCNPDHLFSVALGTPKASVGQANGRSKLTPIQVAEIRRAHAAGERSVKELARLNGVSPKAIRMVLQGQTWGDQ
jgi:integrase